MVNEHKTEVLIIGAGPGGYVAAIRLGQLGKRVLVAEQERAGGVCLNWGCIPTKALLHAVQTLRLAREATTMGFHFAQPEKDLGQLAAWRGRVVERLVRGTEYLLKQNGVELVKARAEFADEKRVRLNHPDGSVTLVAADNIIIATGSEPVALPGLEPDRERIITSNEAVLLNSMPARMLIVGAGAIGLEFASIYAGLGSQVTVVEIMDQVLPGSDRELAGLLERALRKQGIGFMLETRVVAVDKGSALRVTLAAGQVSSQQSAVSSPSAPPLTAHSSLLAPLDVDSILVAVGRRPLTRCLALDRSNVRVGAKGYIEVNERLETSRTAVYAIGDVARPPLLAHKASREGICVAERIAGSPFDLNLQAVPNCVFTDPELATVGLSESEAAARGHDVVIGKAPLIALGRAATLNRTEGMCKIVVDRKTDRVLGVHILAPEASSLIGEGALAVALGLTSEAIGSTIHPHPTLSELIQEAAEAVHGKAIHILNSKNMNAGRE
jgi:dihydrolipoamide dehydrogenase